MFDSLFPKHWTTLQRLMWLKTNALARAVYEIITGNPVTFSAIAAPLKQLSVAFSPVQDLHGYDSPWPAGGGKNLWNPQPYTGIAYNAGIGADVALTESSGATVDGNSIAYDVAAWGGKCFVMRPPAAGTYHLHVDVSAITNPRITLYSVGSDNKTKTCENYTSGSAIDSNRVIDEGDYVVIFIGSNIAQTITISDPQLEAGTSFTSFAPYSNECPISGWDGVEVEQAQTEWKNVGGYWYSKTNYPTRLSLGELLPIEPNTSYTVTIAGNLHFAVQQYNNTDESQTTNVVLVDSGWRTETYTFTSHQSANYVWLLLSSPNYSFNITPADGYAQGLTMAGVYPTRSISISFGSTVYSGTLDVLTGVGEVTGVGYTIPPNRTNLYGNWCYSNCVRDDYGITKNFTIKECNWLKIGTYSQLTGSVPTICIENGGYVYFGWDEMKTVMGQTQEAARQYLTDHPLVITFDLPTPIPIQLTPQEVESLAGDNTMWTDANGDLTVEYRSA